MVLILTAGFSCSKPFATSTKAFASAGSPKTRKSSPPLRLAGVAAAGVAMGAVAAVGTSAAVAGTAVASVAELIAAVFVGAGAGWVAGAATGVAVDAASPHPASKVARTVNRQSTR